MVDPHQVQNRRVVVVNVARLVDNADAVLVDLAVNHSSLTPAPAKKQENAWA